MAYKSKRAGVKSKIRQFGQGVRLVGSLGKEIGRRVISPSYTHGKIFGKPKK